MTTERARGEATDRYCLDAGEAAGLLANHPWRRFVVLGDSVAEGLGDPVPGYPDLPWAERIAAELSQSQPELAFLNLGRSNTLAADVRAGQLDSALEFAPDLALVACGGYDVLRPAFDPLTIEAEIEMIVSALVARGADVITVGIFDGSRSPGMPERFRAGMEQRLRELADATRRVADRFGTVHVDLSTHPAAGEADVYSADGIHGNRRAHAISAAEAVRALGARLASVKSGGPDAAVTAAAKEPTR
ncbi:SGNH/GDSL hydrolase family protein [Streptacidiphilus sp. P02-A3a]|uniref:SGNH/GDSL hydrolase family protein n=1 Tax=Streptacidiphilus sp. P02-A3a TaxID=2704468 RepID=UPI0015FD1EC3|nr:SGNH/GDSL hydrolase family protein [Streptacidiphilus sp. P02-A3a]QMU69589.1 SGNH/GDSL hydrolase family protein [Streptacidiphilus sp. P02-A3a]